MATVNYFTLDKNSSCQKSVFLKKFSISSKYSLLAAKISLVLPYMSFLLRFVIGVTVPFFHFLKYFIYNSSNFSCPKYYPIQHLLDRIRKKDNKSDKLNLFETNNNHFRIDRVNYFNLYKKGCIEKQQH